MLGIVRKPLLIDAVLATAHFWPGMPVSCIANESHKFAEVLTEYYCNIQCK